MKLSHRAAARFAAVALCAASYGWIAPALAAAPPPSPAPAAPPTDAPPALQRYTLGIIYRGAAWAPERSARVDSLQAGHLANITRMFKLGKLVGAGPFLDNAHVIGLFIFSADSAEAAALVAADPAIRSQRFAISLLPWWADAGIGDAYRATHADDAADAARMEQLQFCFLLRGPKWQPVETAETQALQAAHVEHLRSMSESGELVAAGPFSGDSDLRGALVFRCDSTTARRLAADDPKVKFGWLKPAFHPWMVAEGVIPPGRKPR